jgi:dTDP-4-dehydrorhamnose reductase
VRTFLVTGARGQLGYELLRELAPLGAVIAPGREELDLARPETARAAVRRHRPQVVVNAAAYTAVDRAESEPELAAVVNAEAPGVLAEAAREIGAALVHYSTDYVFDGAKDGAYVEDDATGPLSTYGRTKLAGERAVAEAGCPYLVLRTSWVFGARGHNFLRTILRLAAERPTLRIVADQYGAPTWSRLLAAGTALALAAARGVRGDLRDGVARASGTYHLTAAGRTSWHGFASRILECAPAGAARVCTAVEPITTAEYPSPARRPANSVLDSGRFAETFGIRLPSWEAQLDLALNADG